MNYKVPTVYVDNDLAAFGSQHFDLSIMRGEILFVTIRQALLSQHVFEKYSTNESKHDVSK